MSCSKYFGSFEDIFDVRQQFQTEDIEDSEVLFASYFSDDSGYEGRAVVIFLKNSQLFIVEGSHCSCHGLEGQWEPVETNVEALLGFDLFFVDSYSGYLNNSDDANNYLKTLLDVLGRN